MRNKINSGQLWPYENTGTETIASGQLVIVNAPAPLVAVAVGSIVPGSSGMVDTQGLFALPKDGNAVLQGAPLYAVEGKVSPMAPAENPVYAGRAGEAAAQGADTALVVLNVAPPVQNASAAVNT